MSDHGGRRVGAGRPRTGVKRGGAHRVRPDLDRRHPVHVVLRVGPRAPRLRQGRIRRVLRRVLARYVGGAAFRIVHVSLQHNHVHMIVEADDRRALARGMQSFAICAARAIHTVSGSRGKVFAGRYHATQIVSARQARNTLNYVLNNWRRHREDLVSPRSMQAHLDPYASGLAFRGWSQRFSVPAGFEPLPVSPPHTQLLRIGWLRHGLLDPFAKPGPTW
jgi:REP element-mobilizing transposase RayT